MARPSRPARRPKTSLKPSTRRHPRRSATELNDLVRDWIDRTGAQSVVIQGEGDPLAAQDVVVETLRLAQGSGAQFRLNTLGVGATDAIFDALGLVDTVSIFLPAAEASKYDELLQPREPGAFEDACAFVRRASAVSNVEVTAVDRPDVDVAAVEALATSLGAAQFRTRSWLG